MKTIYTSERKAWREWLAEHFETESEIWFVFPMKESGDKALSYNDAVEEALCFGWIDSTIKHIDPTHRAQRFTPRKKGSPYSRPNIERLIWLDEQGLLHPSIISFDKDYIDLFSDSHYISHREQDYMHSTYGEYYVSLKNKLIFQYVCNNASALRIDIDSLKRFLRTSSSSPRNLSSSPVTESAALRQKRFA